MGFLGEQGAESIHASFNPIQRVYSGIPNKVDRLLWVMQEHYLPDNVTLKPQIKKKSVKGAGLLNHIHTHRSTVHIISLLFLLSLNMMLATLRYW